MISQQTHSQGYSNCFCSFGSYPMMTHLQFWFSSLKGANKAVHWNDIQCVTGLEVQLSATGIIFLLLFYLGVWITTFIKDEMYRPSISRSVSHPVSDTSSERSSAASSSGITVPTPVSTSVANSDSSLVWNPPSSSYKLSIIASYVQHFQSDFACLHTFVGHFVFKFPWLHSRAPSKIPRDIFSAPPQAQLRLLAFLVFLAFLGLA